MGGYIFIAIGIFAYIFLMGIVCELAEKKQRNNEKTKTKENESFKQ